MRSPTTALLWQVWRSKRQAVWALVCITIVSWLTDLGAPARPRGAGPGPLNELGAMFSFLLLFWTFSFTEAGGERGIGRFPLRLFTLPVSTLRLIAVPGVAGVVAVEVLYLAWMGRLTMGGSTSPLFVAVLLGAFMVFYQTILWTLPRLGALRLAVVGAICMSLFGIGLLPPAAETEPSPWLTEQFLGGAVAAAAVGSFLFAWNRVARLRTGCDRAPGGLDSLAALLLDLLPSRRRPFASPAAAQFWYEWRSAGTALPVLVGAGLLLAAPFTSPAGDGAGNGMEFVLTALMAPIVLAVPVGMAFAKPVFWSEDLSVPSFIAVRPLGAAALIAVKLRVAALATLLSWLIVVAVLLGWLGFRGNLEGVSQFAIQLWAFHQHSVLAVYGIAALVVAGGIVLTWRFLVVGLWAGHSGNRRLYVTSVLGAVLLVATCIGYSANRLPGWVLEAPERMVPFVWGAAFAVIAKYWLATRTCRDVDARLVRRYFVVWLVGTASLVALGMVFWRIARIYVALDSYRLQSLLILLALLAVPVARVGLAPGLLEQNRHRR